MFKNGDPAKALADAQRSHDRLEAQREEVTGELERARHEEHEALISGENAGRNGRIALRVSNARDGLIAIGGAIAELQGRVSELTAELEESRAQQVRLERSREIERQSAALADAYTAFSWPTAELIAALHAGGTAAPECEAAARLIASTAEQIDTAMPNLRKLLEGAAKAALLPPRKTWSPPTVVEAAPNPALAGRYHAPRSGMPPSPLRVPGLEQVQK
jgi:chromosome segregation ATPase